MPLPYVWIDSSYFDFAGHQTVQFPPFLKLLESLGYPLNECLFFFSFLIFFLFFLRNDPSEECLGAGVSF